MVFVLHKKNNAVNDFIKSIHRLDGFDSNGFTVQCIIGVTKLEP